MKKIIRLCFLLVLCTVMFWGFSLSASAVIYEPDGSSSVEYRYVASDCDRTLVVNCINESGALLKQVQFKTKRGEELLVSVNLNGYEIVGFESDQGLWETCKLSTSSVNYVNYASIFIRYYFRTGMSQEILTATVTLRKSQDIKVMTRHHLRSDFGIEHNYRWFEIEEADTCTVSYGAPFTSSSKDFAGHYLLTGYATQIEGMSLPNGYPPLISGPFSYSMIANAYGIKDITDWMKWDVVDGDLRGVYEEYTEYNEAKDGSLGYCKNRILFLELYYDRSKCEISFSANGGRGVPDSITEYYGFNVTIPDKIPVREDYFFLGWSVDAEATEAEFFAGDSYRVTGNTVLYAVWEKDDYEFSISDLTILEENIFQNSIITVRVRTDNWDRNDAYDDIPVTIYFDGQLLTTQMVDFEVYGIAYVTFEIDVGTRLGAHKIAIWINHSGLERETDRTNNYMSTTITVVYDVYAFGVEVLTENVVYTEGMTVITSYLVSNDSTRMVLPSTGAIAEFMVYYYNENGERVVIHLQAWYNLVIPVGEYNLVYFKWTVPEDFAGTEVHCVCTVNGNGDLQEYNRTNNTATLTTTIAKRSFSQTPNSTFAPHAPSDYAPQKAPEESVGSVSWTMWEYEDGKFVLKTYGIKIADSDPEIKPGSNCTTAVFEENVWTMKSGYGITMSLSPSITELGGSIMPTEDSYTDIQSVYARFPEYSYSVDHEEYRTLEEVGGEWCFAENENADNRERLHYIPIWLSDGGYLVSVMLTELWTPAGRISAVRNSNVIVIDGSLYDDWYS